MNKKIKAFLLSIVALFILGEIIVRAFNLISDFPYQKSKNDILMYEYIPNFSGKMWGKEFKTNSFGCRDYNYSIDKNPSSFRIIVLGDSITVGEGLALYDTDSKILETILNKAPIESGYNHFEVMNFGICAYNTAREVELLKEKGIMFNPDMIIIQYCLDDVIPSVIETLSRAGYQKPWTEIIKFIQDVMFKLKFSRFIQYLRQKALYYAYVIFEEHRVEKMGGLANLLYSESATNWLNTRNALKEFAEITKKNKINSLLVIFPRFESLNDNYPYKKAHQLIKDVCVEAGIPVLDLFDTYKGMNTEALRLSEKKFDWWHPNKLGNKIAAEAIYKYIISNKDNILLIKE